jgi:hypothetical protein
MDQGGELACSADFQDMILCTFHYTIKSMGVDSPSQNGAAKIYKDKFAVHTRTLLYGLGLPTTFWSSALLHSVYLPNHLMHQETGVTPFERYYGSKPDLNSLKVFGSRVCVKKIGNRCGKLDRNDFTGIFLGYTATDQNIVYLDLETGIVKQSRHAQFDEAWYLQATRPLAAQLLYNLGLEVNSCTKTVKLDVTPPWPPLPSRDLDLSKWKVSPIC